MGMLLTEDDALIVDQLCIMCVDYVCGLRVDHVCMHMCTTSTCAPHPRVYHILNRPGNCTCSWRHRMLRIMGLRVNAWWISIEAPPGYANNVSTPSRSKHCTRMSQPLRGWLPWRSVQGRGPGCARDALAASRAAASCVEERSVSIVSLV